jgi:hypothetical protein
VLWMRRARRVEFCGHANGADGVGNGAMNSVVDTGGR